MSTFVGQYPPFKTDANGNILVSLGGSGGFVSSITGTANQIIASSATGDVILSTPQNIGTASSPTFGSVTVVAAPSASTDLTNKAYVDTFLSGLTKLAACVVATTASLTVSYANGAAGVGATLTNLGTQAALTIDTILLSVSDRVLVKDQAASAQNGIYTVTSTGSGATNWVLTRATDFDTSAKMLEGSYTNITSGTVPNKGSIWVFATSAPIVVGTTALTFSNLGLFVTSVFGRAGAVVAASGDYTSAQITGLGTIVNEEVPSGTINSINTAFTLAHTPVSGSVALYLAGARQWNNAGGDYTISGTTITFAIAPTVGPLLADYRY